MTGQANATVSQAAARVGHYRWIIVGLLFAATVINYVDRQMIGVLKPTLMADLGWSELDFANIVFWFQTAYAIGYIGFGRIVDLIGAKLGYAIAFVIWTIAHIAHGGAYSVTQFAMVRFGLGIGEPALPGGTAVTNGSRPRSADSRSACSRGANIGGSSSARHDLPRRRYAGAPLRDHRRRHLRMLYSGSPCTAAARA